MCDVKRTLIFTYGTLKRGFPNHVLMEDLISTNDALYLGAYRTTHQLPLVCGPYGIPFLLNLPGFGSCAAGELYAVSDGGLARLDELEGTSLGHYERLPIRVRAEDNCGGHGGGNEGVAEAEAYYAHRSFAEEMWKKEGLERLDAYTEKEAKEYVKRDDRPRSFLEEIRLFVSSSSSSD